MVYFEDIFGTWKRNFINVLVLNDLPMNTVKIIRVENGSTMARKSHAIAFV